MKQRILSILMTLCLCLTLLPTAALADTAPSGTALTASHSGQTLSGGTAEAPAEYYLSGDVTLTSPITATGYVTLDLNGHTLTGRLLVGSSGTPAYLTVKDSGTGGKVANSGRVISVNNGSLTLESGTVSSSASSSSEYVIAVASNTTVTLKGGTVSAPNGCVAIYVEYSGSVDEGGTTLYADGGTVSGLVENYRGTITCSTGVTTATKFTGTVKNGGTIAWGTYSGTVENGYSDDSTGHSGTITGGTFNGTVTNSYHQDDGSGLPSFNGTMTGGTFNGTVEVATAEQMTQALERGVTTIRLGDSFTLTSTLTIAAGKTVTLDLNGKTMSMLDTTNGANYFMIENYGDLTIKDSGTGGKLSFNSTVVGISGATIPSYSKSTIGNAGTLTVENGTIENKTPYVEGYARYVIDTLQYSTDTKINIKGGKLLGSGTAAIRQIPWSTTLNNTLNISGGNITGGYAAVVTHGFVVDGSKATVNITGGTLTGNICSYYIDYDYYNGSQLYDGTKTSVYISNGTFNGIVGIFNNIAGSNEKPFANVSVTGGTFNSCDDDNNDIYVYTTTGEYGYSYIRALAGGTYAHRPYSGYVADGYIGKKLSDSCFIIVPKNNLTSGVYTADPTGYLADGYYVSAVDEDAWLWTVSSRPAVPSKPLHDVTVQDAPNGEVDSNRDEARQGSIVTITVAPDAGYTLESLTVLDKNGNALTLNALGGNQYSFIMPDGDVTVRASFTDGTSTGFVDVPASKYFYDAVNWAVTNGITGGVDATHFAPYASCTRGQLVTFLWRALGEPEAKTASNPFTDVKEGSAFYQAILWASENDIVGGYADGTFHPSAAVTRQQAAAILYRYAKFAKMDVSVGEDTNILSFNDAFDVSEYAIAGVQWAVGAQVMQGSEGYLYPYHTCTRAQIVTMLYRLLAK